MKMKKTILGVSVLLIVSIVIGVFVLPKPQEKVATKLLSELYTVTDYKFINDVKNMESQTYIENEQYVIKVSAPYKDLLTERGLEQFLANGMLTTIDKIALEFNCKFYVDKINLSNITKVDNNKFQYDFEVFINDGEKNIKPKGSIVVKKVNSVWKVEYLKIFNPKVWQNLKQ